MGKCDWDVIKQIKENLSIPVFANGGIYNMEDVVKCLEYTNVDGVMSAEALLENPALFYNTVIDLDELAFEYMELAKFYQARSSEMKAHLFKILYVGLTEHTDLREQLAKAHRWEEYKKIVDEMKNRREKVDKKDKFGWYLRY